MFPVIGSARTATVQYGCLVIGDIAVEAIDGNPVIGGIDLAPIHSGKGLL